MIRTFVRVSNEHIRYRGKTIRISYAAASYLTVLGVAEGDVFRVSNRKVKKAQVRRTLKFDRGISGATGFRIYRGYNGLVDLCPQYLRNLFGRIPMRLYVL